MKKIIFSILIMVSFTGKSQEKLSNDEYKLNCNNPYQILDISNDKAYISVYNNIFVNAIIKKNKMIYELFYSYNEPIPTWEKKIDSLNISKTVSFATIKKTKGGIMMQWKGLYNTQTGKRDFSNNAIFEEDNDNHKKTIFLKKCK